MVTSELLKSNREEILPGLKRNIEAILKKLGGVG